MTTPSARWVAASAPASRAAHAALRRSSRARISSRVISRILRVTILYSQKRTMTPGTLCCYRTDPDGKIIFVDEGWCAFARENGAPEYAVPEALYGRELLSFISEPTTLHIYSVLMQRVMNHRQWIKLPFRCDAPEVRRWLELEMRPWEGGIEFRTRT